MAPVTHQTIRLSRGNHASPESGACVMELASMLADEPFSDHPASVCPVIASLLRRYNDSVDERRRQDLKHLAARVIGSRADRQTEMMRLIRLRDWALSVRASRGRWARLTILDSAEIARTFSGIESSRDVELVSRYAAAVIRKPNAATHRKVLALVDELLAMAPRRDSRTVASGAGT